MLLIVLLLLVPSAFAKKGGMTLLAVSEKLDGYEGSLASLYLDIRPGEGNVFVDTFPISKIDTQISMRFAKQIACKYLEEDCSRHDFIYTIRAESGIVGGPSAGAAASVLTVSLLKGLELNESVAITGTINSGGIIGPVGGLKAKIDVASENGFKKVLIPRGETLEFANLSANMSEYAEGLDIEVVEVTNIDDAVYEFTGKRFQKERLNLTVNPEYQSVMESIAVSMCGRSAELEKAYMSEKAIGRPGNASSAKEESALESKGQGDEMMAQERYYSGASFCFSSNIKLKELVYTAANISKNERSARIANLRKSLESLEKDLGEKEMRTISDLQTYMIVDDRVQDAKNALDSAGENDSEAVYWLAYAEERYHSITNWIKFFDRGGAEFELDNETLKNACMTKISEANERLQYVRYYFPSLLEDTDSDLENARKDLNSGSYVLCIFKASKAKAESNIVLSVMGVGKDQVQNLLDEKISVAEQSIAEQQENGIFPIMAYSYYEYAKSLSGGEELSSALLYAEYALELSNFDIYFEKEKGRLEIPFPEYRTAVAFFAGILAGMAASWLVIRGREKLLLRSARLAGKSRKARRKRR
jgi:uncharacterized protein